MYHQGNTNEWCVWQVLIHSQTDTHTNAMINKIKVIPHPVETSQVPFRNYPKDEQLQYGMPSLEKSAKETAPYFLWFLGQLFIYGSSRHRQVLTRSGDWKSSQIKAGASLKMPPMQAAEQVVCSDGKWVSPGTQGLAGTSSICSTQVLLSRRITWLAW